MSRIDELINQYCPEGVTYKTLGELGKFYGGLTGKSKSDFIDGNAVFISYKNVYSNPSLDQKSEERVKISKDENQRTLEYGDVIFTGSSETPDECGISSVVTEVPETELYLNSFCFIFRFDDTTIMNPHFAKHLFRSGDLRYQIGKTANGVTRYNVSKKLMEKVSIPVPPLEVQSEIVRVLDSFTLLTAELTAELTARKKQYEYYHQKLLTFDESIPRKKISEVCDLSSGGDVPKDRFSDVMTDKYCVPIYSNGVDKEGLYGFTDMPRITKPAVTIAGRGAGVGNTFLRKEPYFPIIRLVSAVPHDDVDVDYLYHCISAIEFKIPQGGIPQLTVPMVSSYEIPVPDINIQRKIAKELNAFKSLVEDINVGIPAEIDAREKQYAYYRDLVFEFKKVGDVV